MKGDALASGAKTAKFTQGEELTEAEYNKRVGEAKKERKPFAGCNVPGCEDFVAYSGVEFSDHVHEVH